MSGERSQHKQQARLLKLLMKATLGGLPVEIVGSKIIMSFQDREFSFPKAIYVQGLSGKAIEENDGCLEITDMGRIIARQLLHPDIEFEAPMQSRSSATIPPAAGSSEHPRNVVLNLSESPLMRLYSRRDKKTGKAI